jgi:hypothetical protein
VIFAGQGSHACASQFVHGRYGFLWISGGVSDHQLKGSSSDPAGIIDFTNGQLKSSEQMPTGFGPARPSQRNKSADLDG